MKSNKVIISIILASAIIITFPITAYANSSWCWLSQTRPYDLLPVAIIVSLLLEILSINHIAKVKDLKKVIPVVMLANLVSFLLPYVWLSIDPMNVYAMFPDGEGLFRIIGRSVEHTPVFTISIFYLVLTILIEVPIVFLFLRKVAINKKALILTIIIANVITTAFTFVVEHIFCYGAW